MATNHCIDYVEFQGWVGEGSESTDALTVPARIQGTYQIDMEFSYSDGTKTIDYATITVDNNVGSWNDDSCGSGTMDIGEQRHHSSNVRVIHNSSLKMHSDDYGCYTFGLSHLRKMVSRWPVHPPAYYEFEEQQASNNDGSYSWESFERSQFVLITNHLRLRHPSSGRTDQRVPHLPRIHD